MAKRKKDLLAILSDKPTKDDLLNFKDYSDLLTNVVVNSETPSTIGIFGDWGSGKTSLMLMIDEHLQKKNIKTIWFNAWKYDKEEALWRALIFSILKGLSAGQKEIDDATLKLYAAVSTESLGKVQIDWLEIGKTALKGIVFFMAPLLLIPGIANAFANAGFLDQISNAFTKRKVQQSQERISSIEQFEDLYKQLIANYFDGGERVVVFIDDLDRCLPIRSLEVFEALKSFLDADGCVYVVACDTRLIDQGLREKYTDKSGINIEDYLGKIVQFSFAIPPIRTEDAEHFIKNLGWGIDSDEILHLISATLERNPRKLKRFLTDLKIKGQLVKTRSLLLKSETLIKMSCISYTWKDFWSASLKDISVFDRAQRIAFLSADIELSPDDMDFKKLFQIDERLCNYLCSQPTVTSADLHEYIFLSTATSASLPEKQVFEKAGNLNELQNIKKHPFFDGFIDLGYIDQIIPTINNGAKLIMLSGVNGSGKTTLLRMIDQLDASSFVPVYIKMIGLVDGYKTTNKLFYELARLISQSIVDKGILIHFKPRKDEITFSEFEEFFAKVSAAAEHKEKRLVLMIDDVGPLFLTAVAERFDRDFTLNARKFLFEHKNLAVILGSNTNINNFPQSIRDSIIGTIDLQIELGKISSKNSTKEYEQLMSMSINEYTNGDAYRLLFLCENQLRQLISTQFDRFDWWERGLPKNISDRASRILNEMRTTNVFVNSENTSLLEVLSLGELFKLILDNDTWENIFKNVFPSKTFIETTSSMILRARNSIAHSRSLFPDELKHFIVTAKDLLKLIYEKNLEQ